MTQREANWSHWSIRSLFGIGITSACPVAFESNIYIDTTSGSFDILPEGQESASIEASNKRTLQVFDIKKLVESGINNLNIKAKKATVYGLIPKPTLHATRYFKGHGNEKGGIITKIFNEGQQPLKVVYLDIIPWYLRIYLHTLKVVTNGQHEVKPLKLDFVPGVDRKRPYSLELILELAPKSSLEISIEFEKSILKWLEYPPDANKGFYVNSALISAILPNKANFTGIDRMASTYAETFKGQPEGPTLIQLFTESLLVNLPTPDFSMPYNVICLTCTVVALAFGPLHNITNKSLTLVEPSQVPVGLVGNILNKAKSIFTRRTPKASEEGQSENDQVNKEGQSEGDQACEESKKDK